MADAHINPQTGNWDDNYYNTVGKYGGSTGDPNTDLINSNNNAYINQLLAQAGGQHDLAIKQLDAQHQLALGNNDDQTARFLESVASQLENQIGRIPYDYQTYTNRENQQYALGNQQIAQGRQLALDKLAEDERSQQAALNLQQGQQNQSLAEDLNSRGLVNGQALSGLTGGMPTTQGLGNVQGIGSYAANSQNQDFANQRVALANSIGLQNRDITQNYGFQQQQANLQHQNTLQDLTTSARRDTQDAQNQYQFGTQQANLDYQQQQQALERQRLALQLAAPAQAYTLSSYQKGLLGS